MQQLKSNSYSTKLGTKVCIPWSRQDLNEFCAWAEEQFGLPGDRFQWVPEKSHMEFYFKDERDAEWFILRWI
jgi:hypothetical protein